MGKGRSLFSMSRPSDCHQSPQVSSGSDPICHLFGNVLGFTNFEGFHLSGEGFRPSDSDRISILQAARLRLLVQSARQPVAPLPVSPRRLTLDAVSPAHSPLLVGLCKQVGGEVDPVELGGPSLVVRHLQPPARCFPRGGSPQPSLLVRRIRPGVGSASTGPFLFGPLVSGRKLPVNQPSGAPCDSMGMFRFRHHLQGCRWIVRGQHHRAFVCQEARGGGGRSPRLSMRRPSFSFVG